MFHTSKMVIKIALTKHINENKIERYNELIIRVLEVNTNWGLLYMGRAVNKF